MRASERALLVFLGLALLDSGYLSWRYLALRSGIVVPGTGICSWTPNIDCDVVLLTPEANAFFVPNALLGAAFYAGCILWWLVGKRLGRDFHFHLARTLTFWLIVASGSTLWFFWLLARLPAFCPFCPLNHLFTYAALASALVLTKQITPPNHSIRWQPILALVVTCVLFFVFIQLAWYAGERSGLLRSAVQPVTIP